MKKLELKSLIFMALCCALGLFSKKLVSPFANIITDSLHIPGGIATGFSLVFLAVAAALIGRFGCAAVMSAVQSVLAFGFGMVGSMGLLSPIGYIVPGIVMDAVLLVLRKLGVSLADRVVFANAAAGLCAALTANFIVFRLRGLLLLLYCCVALTFGAIFGLLGGYIAVRLGKIIK